MAYIPQEQGQSTMANSTSVAIASDQTALPISGTIVISNPTETGLAKNDTITANIGLKADAAAASDTGSFSILAFIKKGLQNWTSLLARIPSLVSGRIPVDGSGVTQPISGTVTANTGLTQPLTDTQLRAANVNVTVSNPTTATETGLAKETKQNLAVWEAIAGNNKTLAYYVGLAAGNPSGSTSNIQTIQFKTGASVIVTQNFTYDSNNNILTITAA